MDQSTIIAVLTSLGAGVGGLLTGRRMGAAQSVGIAVDTVELLQVQVTLLTQKNEEKDQKIAELAGRVCTLEELVTQRAEVEIVRQAVVGVRGVVDKIALKIGVESDAA